MRALRRAAVGAALSIALLAGQGTIVPVTVSLAADYPSWDDINAAKNNEQAKQTEITRVQGLISGLDAQATAAREALEQAQAAYEEALAKVAAQQTAYDTIRVQQVNAQARADESKRAAGTSIAQMYRSGGANASMNIYLSGDGADTVLYQLGVMGRFGETSDEAYRSAAADAKTAESLRQQADTALTQLQTLAEDASAQAQAAQEAEGAVTAALQEQQANAAQLAAQLASLQGQTEELQQQRAAGVKAEAEAQAKAAAAAAAAAAARVSGGNDSDGAYVPAQTTTPAAPSSGGSVGYPLPYLKGSSGYGMRFHPIYHVNRYHYGTDFAVPTGTPVLSIADGTVISAGYEASPGNRVDVRYVINGQTIITRSFHLSAINVRVGQQVSRGQQLGLSGTTGSSTGPHLHFEVHIGSINYGSPYGAGPGNTVDPAIWLRSR